MTGIPQEVVLEMLRKLDSFYQNALVLADVDPKVIRNINAYVAVQQQRDMARMNPDLF